MTVVLQRRVNFIGQSHVINAYHAELYHGQASRAGVAYPHFRDYHFSDEDATVGLDILRSSEVWPAISVPSLNWVVDRSMKCVLEQFPCLRFLQCKTVQTYPLRMEDLEAFIDMGRRFRDPVDLHRSAARERGMSVSDEPLWEVIAPCGHEMAANAHERVDVTLNWYLYADDETLQLTIASQTLERNPFFIYEGSYFLSDSLYRAVAHGIHPSFFYVDPIEAI
ncbi:MAG: hypothetical protein ACYC0X_33890 [Pirellulaceae bacterium]